MDSFQSGFRPGYGTQIALVDGLWRKLDGGGASILALLDNFQYHQLWYPLGQLRELGMGGIVWAGSSPSSKTSPNRC